MVRTLALGVIGIRSASNSCVVMCNLHHLAEPQFLPLQNGPTREKKEIRPREAVEGKAKGTGLWAGVPALYFLAAEP